MEMAKRGSKRIFFRIWWRVIFILVSVSGVGYAITGDWPTQWSHNMPRPVLFVHGVNADMTSWGVKTDGYMPPLFGLYISGKCSGYKPTSAAKAVADANGIPELEQNSAYDRINHNGIEFYNSLAYSPDGTQEGTPTGLDPFVTIRFTNGVEYDPSRKVYQKGQANQLYNKFIAVLDEYFLDWRTNATRQIDIVCHSQGCLVSRYVIANRRDASLANPVNHIHAIVSVNSPAVGTAFATDYSGVHSVERLRALVFSIYDQGYLNPLKLKVSAYGGTLTWTIDPFKDVRNMLENFMVAQNELQYPSGIYSAGWSPTDSKMGSSGMSSGSPIITPLLNGPLSRPYDGKKIPLTALYGLAPGLAKPMLTLASNQGHSACQENHYASWFSSGVSADDLSVWFQAAIYIASGGKGGTCTDWVNYVVDYLNPIFTELDSQWSLASDFIVDESSQKYKGIFNPFNHPFVVKPLVPNNGEFAVPHMSFSNLGANGGKLEGATEHGAEINAALASEPRQQSLVPTLSILTN